ncbi:MAG: glycosyltransferase family 2 protein [Candidatus Omnitrophota bacterium]
MDTRKRLSAVILTKNIEDKVRDCLESIRWADEIVVVDGFSTDKTVEICREYNARIVQHEFGGDFGQERNIGIDNSSGDWILQLDGDDVVTEGFKNEMVKILQKEDRFAAYKFWRKNFFMGHFMRYGGWYHRSLHLFKKGFALYQGKVHHELIVNGEIGSLDAEIEHYPFDNFSQFVTKQNRYTDIESKEILELKGVLDRKEILYNIKIKPVKLFWKFYVKKQGFKEGVYGFIFSVLFAWVHFIKWVKYWELVRDKLEQ